VPADLRLRLQHDQRPGRPPGRHQAARPADLRDGLRTLRDGLCGGPDRGALRDLAHHLPRPAPPPPVPMRGLDVFRAAPRRVAPPLPPRLNKARRPRRPVAWALLLLGGLLMVAPFGYMLGASFKGSAEVYELSLVPRAPTLANYRRLFGASGFPRWILN